MTVTLNLLSQKLVKKEFNKRCVAGADSGLTHECCKSDPWWTHVTVTKHILTRLSGFRISAFKSGNPWSHPLLTYWVITDPSLLCWCVLCVCLVPDTQALSAWNTDTGRYGAEHNVEWLLYSALGPCLILALRDYGYIFDSSWKTVLSIQIYYALCKYIMQCIASKAFLLQSKLLSNSPYS